MEECGWDDEEAIQGAANLVSQCLAMGGSWTRVNPQTQRVNFLRLSFEWQEQFSESWQSFREEFGKPVAPSELGVNAEPIGNDRAESTGKDIIQKKDVAKAALLNKGNGKGKSEDKDKDKSNANGKQSAILVAAIKMRQKYLGVTSLAMTIDEQITREETWSWAKNDQNQGVLTKTVAELKGSLSQFGRQWVSEEPTTMRRKFANAKELFTKELANFTESANPKVKALEIKCVELQKKHNA